MGSHLYYSTSVSQSLDIFEALRHEGHKLPPSRISHVHPSLLWAHTCTESFFCQLRMEIATTCYQRKTTMAAEVQWKAEPWSLSISNFLQVSIWRWHPKSWNWHSWNIHKLMCPQKAASWLNRRMRSLSQISKFEQFKLPIAVEVRPHCICMLLLLPQIEQQFWAGGASWKQSQPVLYKIRRVMVKECLSKVTSADWVTSLMQLTA